MMLRILSLFIQLRHVGFILLIAGGAGYLGAKVNPLESLGGFILGVVLAINIRFLFKAAWTMLTIKNANSIEDLAQQIYTSLMVNPQKKSFTTLQKSDRLDQLQKGLDSRFQEAGTARVKYIRHIFTFLPLLILRRKVVIVEFIDIKQQRL